jgi:hypothetical protein
MARVSPAFGAIKPSASKPRALLAPIDGWISKSFDVPVLMDAKATARRDGVMQLILAWQDGQTPHRGFDGVSRLRPLFKADSYHKVALAPDACTS